MAEINLTAVQRTIEADSFLMQAYLSLTEEGVASDEALTIVYQRHIQRSAKFKSFYLAQRGDSNGTHA